VPDTDHEGPSPSALLSVLSSAREAGFLGPGRIATHVRHAEGFATLARRLSVEPPAGGPPAGGSGSSPTTPGRTRLLDLGSGGGLPGLVLAERWPEADLVLLDAMERRTDFLRGAVSRCGLGDRVSVVHQRAEVAGRDPALRGTFDGVVVRSFGPPAVVAECTAPFLHPGGWVIVSEPPGSAGDGALGAPDETGPDGGPGTGYGTRWPAGALAQLGLEPVEFVRAEFGYQVLRQREGCPERYPRRNGVPTKSPLF
jgi:16S rRNA (guanine527-N7)-methyltransferase